MATIVEIVQSESDMSLLLKYNGPAVDDGTMDVYETATNMMAFSDYVVTAAHAIFGEETQVKAEVSAFKSGSFETDLLFHLAGFGASMWSASTDIGGLLLAIKESLGLYKFLRGQPPARVERLDDHSVNVTNNNGEMIVVQTQSLYLTLDRTAGAAAEKFVAHALSKPGIDSIDVSSSKGSLIRADKGEAEFFRPIVVEELIESTVQIALTLETPTFRDGKKWQFWDGEGSIQATMEDQTFLDAIDKGEPFRKGDVLICELRIRQVRAGKTLRSERTIVRVIRHIQRFGEQSDFFGA